jgi:hypothetical protein
VTTRPRHLALCTNERTLLSVVVPLAPIAAFVPRFQAAAQRRVSQINTSAAARQLEIVALARITLAPTANRSVLSSMTQFAFAARAWLEESPFGDLEELGLWLCDTPCSALQTHFPWEEAEMLLSRAAPEQ